MEQRPYRERYYAVIGAMALAFGVLRALREDWAVAAVLVVVAAVLFLAAAFDRA